jgi:hypothetical protein
MEGRFHLPGQMCKTSWEVSGGWDMAAECWRRIWQLPLVKLLNIKLSCGDSENQLQYLISTVNHLDRLRYAGRLTTNKMVHMLNTKHHNDPDIGHSDTLDTYDEWNPTQNFMTLLTFMQWSHDFAGHLQLRNGSGGGSPGMPWILSWRYSGGQSRWSICPVGAAKALVSHTKQRSGFTIKFI